MFTATIVKKEETGFGLKLTVEFTNGTRTLIEEVLPQDRDGFDHWLESRLKSLETGEELKTELVEGVSVVPLEKVVSVETPVDAWLKKYYKLVRVKQTLVDTGVVPANNPRYVALLDEVRTGLKANPDFFNAI